MVFPQLLKREVAKSLNYSKVHGDKMKFKDTELDRAIIGNYNYYCCDSCCFIQFFSLVDTFAFVSAAFRITFPDEMGQYGPIVGKWLTNTAFHLTQKEIKKKNLKRKAEGIADK